MKLSVLLLASLAGTCFAAAPERVVIPSGKLDLPGYWFEAKGEGPRPAVIDLHGCGGPYDSKGRLGARFARDAAGLAPAGVHLLALDSFTPRGLKSICEIRPRDRTVKEEDRRDDVYAAIAWLAARSDVNPARIGLVGRSHGGQTVLSAMDESAPAVRAQPIRPRAAVAFYPGCSRFVRMTGYEIGKPLLIMIGEKDNWTPAKRCVELREKLAHRQPDAPLELIVYPGSYHGFDGPAPLRIREHVPTKTGSAMVGGNPVTGEQATRRMFEFLAAQLEAPGQVFGTRPIR